MELEVLKVPFSLHGRVAFSLRKVQGHGLIEQLKTLHLFDGALRRFGVIEDYKCLPFGF